MTPNKVPYIPKDCKLVFVAEGAANTVYEIHPSIPPPPSPRESYIEEYSESTPPPSIIDIEAEEEEEQRFDTSFFHSECSLFRFRCSAAKFPTSTSDWPIMLSRVTPRFYPCLPNFFLHTSYFACYALGVLSLREYRGCYL
jgi:hypothetical protein